MPLKGKRLATGHEARAIIERELSVALKRAGFILQGFLMRNSPVKTGTLRRSWSVGEPQVGGRPLYREGGHGAGVRAHRERAGKEQRIYRALD
jgi:hypothetical protein